MPNMVRSDLSVLGISSGLHTWGPSKDKGGVANMARLAIVQPRPTPADAIRGGHMVNRVPITRAMNCRTDAIKLGSYRFFRHKLSLCVVINLAKPRRMTGMSFTKNMHLLHNKRQFIARGVGTRFTVCPPRIASVRQFIARFVGTRFIASVRVSRPLT
jgi:hypothetical protein